MTSNLTPAFIAKVSASELFELFPVQFQELDPLQAPEPSSLALLHFPSGPAAVVHGRATDTITVSLPDDDRASLIFQELMDDVPLGERHPVGSVMVSGSREGLAPRPGDILPRP